LQVAALWYTDNIKRKDPFAVPDDDDDDEDADAELHAPNNKGDSVNKTKGALSGSDVEMGLSSRGNEKDHSDGRTPMPILKQIPALQG
jgi:hypothetical protein